MTCGWAFQLSRGQDDLIDRACPLPPQTVSVPSAAQRKQTMMDYYFRGPLWIIFIVSHSALVMSCPYNCKCILNGAVMCNGHAITDIPETLPLNTFLLLLNDTSMNVINEKSLANRKLMLRFSLTYSHLHTIHPLAFQVAPQLKSVKLSSNDLASLPAHVFSPLTDLEQLHLDRNNLQTIASEMFDGLVGLLDLDLRQNNLTNPPSDVFDGLTKLISLNLGRNNIKTLPPNIFHSLTNLRNLSLYHNELEVLEPGMFDTLLNLVELKIHHNQIASLPPQLFWSLRNLKILTLSSNQLQDIPERSFYNMPKLIQLTIYSNPLLALPDQLMGHMPDMRDFYLHETNLTTVPENMFANMSGLLRLNIHLNPHLEYLPADLFCCLPYLEKLSLRANNLSHLNPQLFSKLTSLRTLLLNDNHLLNLEENIFHGLGELLNIDLYNNVLKRLPGGIFLTNTVLKELRLGNNSWDCDCRIKDIARWIRHNENVLTDKENTKCLSPLYQMLRQLGSLHEEEFKHCDATTTPVVFPTKKPKSPTSFHIFSTFGGKLAVMTTPSTPTPVELATSDATTLSTTLHARIAKLLNKQFGIKFDYTTEDMSHLKYDVLVIEQGPEFVHHNIHGGWVYVWYLPSNTALAGFLVFCHIFLVAAGLLLIFTVIYDTHRLDMTMNKFQAEHTRIDE